MSATALLSDCGRYRYTLSRDWGVGPRVVWLMLNPSTADAEVDDPTIRKCMGFARRWGYTGITVVNLYAWRATDPKELRRAQRNGCDVVGPDNDRHLATAPGIADLVVAAWGAHEPAGSLRGDRAVGILTAGGSAQCLGRCKDGQPRHPLMTAYSTALDVWR